MAIATATNTDLATSTLPLLRGVSPLEEVVVSLKEDQLPSSQPFWDFWEPRFRRTRASLLLDDVDDIEERHMDLLPDDSKSKAAKMKSYKYKYNTKQRAAATTKKANCQRNNGVSEKQWVISIAAIPRPQFSSTRFLSI